MSKWEPVTVKAQLRLASQRLGQVQAKNDSQANITYTDIATLIQKGNVSLAREKAEKLVMDEAYGDLLEVLELQIGVALERFQELERGVSPSPVMIEATSTIIYAAPHIHSKDLDAVRISLIQRLGPDFARSASGNRDKHVSQRALKAISPPIPSAAQLDAYMKDIAQSHGVNWNPDPPRQTLVNVLSELLDPEVNPVVDLPQLRKLCRHGISDEPTWLRPRIWRLLLATVPSVQASRKTEIAQQRDSYYDLVRRLLEPISHPSRDSSSADAALLEAYNQLSGLPKNIFAYVEEEPEVFPHCPLSDNAPEDIRIPFSRALEMRLKVLRGQETESSRFTPEIRLEGREDVTPGISLTPSDPTTSDDANTSMTLLESRKRIFGTAHPQHCSAFLRLVYLHNTINPGNLSYHTPSILIPLYSVLLQEVDAEELAHLEADTFWLLEAMVAEFAGLEDDEGTIWMKKLSDRLSWADFDFKAQLEASGLDPALPHYSYRWLMPILTHTLPLPSLFLVWDALFSQPAREKTSNPKLDYLVDICASMLIRAKNHVIRMSQAAQNGRSLWVDQKQSPLMQGHTQDGFMESLSFLQTYNPYYIGGVERVLQVASDLAQRREGDSSHVQQPTLSLGARFNIWKGRSSQNSNQQRAAIVPSEESRKRTSDYPDSDETTTSKSHTTLASAISNTFWRGITNQSAMEDEQASTPPSPSPEPSTPMNVSPLHPSAQIQSPTIALGSSNIWGYAEKLKSSDTVASISKASSNWRAKAMSGSWSLTGSAIPSNKKDEGHTGADKPRRDSTSFSSPLSPGLLSPPPVPPKTSRSPSPLTISPPSTSGILEKTKSLISRSPALGSTPKSAPKALLLTSGASVVSGHRKSSHPRSGSATSAMSTPDTDEWADVMEGKQHHFHRDSMSSVSSLSPSDAFAFGRIPKSSRSEYESDTSSSRIVALNRRSVSPMAPNFRAQHGRSLSRPSSRASSASSDMHDIQSPPLPPLPPYLARSPLQESSSFESQTFVISPRTRESENSDATSSEILVPSRKPSWKKQVQVSDSENAPTVSNLAKSPRLRSKRQPRPANLEIQDPQHPRLSAEQKSPNPSNLTVEWPGDEQENITTPRASNFDSDDYVTVSPSQPRSPHRTRKLSTADQEKIRKSSMDTIINEERPRKISNGHRVRKVSSGSREVPRSHRESAAEEGDDEGYDELLSAYESEDGPTGTYLR